MSTASTAIPGRRHRSHRRRIRQVMAELGKGNGQLRLLDSKIDFYDEWVASGKRPALKAVERAGASVRSRAREKLRRP